MQGPCKSQRGKSLRKSRLSIKPAYLLDYLLGNLRTLPLHAYLLKLIHRLAKLEYAKADRDRAKTPPGGEGGAGPRWLCLPNHGPDVPGLPRERRSSPFAPPSRGGHKDAPVFHATAAERPRAFSHSERPPPPPAVPLSKKQKARQVVQMSLRGDDGVGGITHTEGQMILHQLKIGGAAQLTNR